MDRNDHQEMEQFRKLQQLTTIEKNPIFICYSPLGLCIVSAEPSSIDSMLDADMLYIVPSNLPCSEYGIPILLNETYPLLVTMLRGVEPLKQRVLTLKINKRERNATIEFHNFMKFGMEQGEFVVRLLIADYKGLSLLPAHRTFGQFDYPSLVRVENTRTAKSQTQIRDNHYIRNCIDEREDILLCTASSIMGYHNSNNYKSLYFYIPGSVDIPSVCSQTSNNLVPSVATGINISNIPGNKMNGLSLMMMKKQDVNPLRRCDKNKKDLATASPHLIDYLRQDHLQTKLDIVVVYKKVPIKIRIPSNGNIAYMKLIIQNVTGVPVANQKLIFKGINEGETLISESGLENGSKIILVGSTNAEINSVVTNTPRLLSKEIKDICPKIKIDVLFIGQVIKLFGKPQELMPSCQHQHPLPDYSLLGMYTTLGTSIKISVLHEIDEIWLCTKGRTTKLPMSSISHVTQKDIQGHPNYCILGLQSRASQHFRFYIFWFPRMYFDSLKLSVCGGIY